MSAHVPLSLSRPSPFYELLRRIRLVDRRGRVRWYWLVAVAWIPLAVATLIRLLAGIAPEALLLDPSVHARLLVAIPLLVLAEHLLEERAARASSLLYVEEHADIQALDAIAERAVSLRESRWAEGILAVLAVLGGQAVLWRADSPSGFVHAVEGDPRLSFATFWYGLLSLPLVYFLATRWLWHWLIWTYVLVRLSRIRLATNALHPDGAAGLRFLSAPIDAFVLFVGATVSVAAAAWSVPVHERGVPLQTFVPPFIVFVLFAIVVACGPLFLFSVQIYRARYRDVGAYHALAHEYANGFRHKWFEEQPREERLLGTDDICALNDLGGSYLTAARTRALPFGARPIVALWVGAIVPILPLALSTVPLVELVQHLTKMLLIPGT